MLRAGLKMLRKLETDFAALDPTRYPKMLVVCEDTSVSPLVAAFLQDQQGLRENEVMTIDSGKKAELTGKDWTPVRERLFGVDRYARLAWPAKSGGLERAFIHWAQADSQVLAFCKISENRHTFARLRYVKDDGLPAFYSPDFLLRTGNAIYLAKTKAQAQAIHPNLQRKCKARR